MKKYIEKLKDLKSTNKKLYIGIVCMLLLVGVTFAYVAAQITGGVFKNLNLFADTTDQLLFDVDKDLSLTATQFNFTEGGSNLSDTSIATARLKANSTNKTANYNYNVYLVIEENEFKYTTADKKTEILLQVTDPNGNALTTLDGLTYNSTLQGFDITEEQGILAVAENFAIASNSSTNWTSQNWTFTVTFINLDTNQKENAGKHMSGKIKIQQLTETPSDLTVAVNNLPDAYGPLATLNCKGSESVYNQQYNRIEVSNISKNQSFCNVTYNDRNEKQYLNDYIIGLEGTTQGAGELVHETFLTFDNSRTMLLSRENYENVLQFTGDYSNSSSGISKENLFLYDNNEWNSEMANMVDGKWNNIMFSLPDNNFYKICYSVVDVSSGLISIFKNNQYFLNQQYISNSSKEERCFELGTEDLENDLYRISIYNYSTGKPISIKFKILSSIEPLEIDTGYRYEGQNPNNYIWFNNELWRIIGVMNKESHGLNELNLVKIIKDDAINGLPIGNSNIWKESNLNKLLNEYYYLKKDGTNSDYCLNYNSINKTKCDFRTTGINYLYRNLIKEVKWISDGELESSSSKSINNLYKFERGLFESNEIQSNDGRIGLMYASDFGYSTLSTLVSRNDSVFTSKGWLYKYGEEWTMTMYKYDSSYPYACTIAFSGSLGSNLSSKSKAIRPTLYLNENVFVLEGDGSIENPYIIGM